MQFPRHEQIDQVPRIQWKWVASYSLSGPTPFSVQYFSTGYHVKGPRNLPAQSKETMCGSWFCNDPFLWLLVFRRSFLVAIIPQSFFTIQRFWHCLGLLETAALPRAGFLCFFPAISLGMPFKHTFGAWFWARPFVTTLSHSKTPLRLLYKRTLLTLPWTPRNGSPSILCCDDWWGLIKHTSLL